MRFPFRVFREKWFSAPHTHSHTVHAATRHNCARKTDQTTTTTAPPHCSTIRIAHNGSSNMQLIFNLSRPTAIRSKSEWHCFHTFKRYPAEAARVRCRAERGISARNALTRKYASLCSESGGECIYCVLVGNMKIMLVHAMCLRVRLHKISISCHRGSHSIQQRLQRILVQTRNRCAW